MRRITKEEVFNKLRGVNDPEFGVSIVDMGLVYGVKIKFVFDPPWSPKLMSEELRARFGA